MSKKLNSILLIDDDESANFLNKLLLENIGCAGHIETVQSGREAISYLAGSTNIEDDRPFPKIPDLIFLDINMPAMDGWQFLELFRMMSARRQKKTIIIMLTASVDREEELRSSAFAEVTAYKNKPLSKKMMEEILQHHFSEQG